MRAAAAIGGALLTGLGVAHGIAFRHHVTDDAFISFRYLNHWLAGEGLVYNAGEAVWGFSNFLWIAAIAPFVGLGVEPLAAARLLGSLFCVGVAIGVLFGWRRPGADPLNLAGAALLAANGAFWMQGWSGLETSAFAGLVLLALCLHRRARDRGTRGRDLAPGFVVALSTLTRPEGVGLFALLVLDAWLERKSADNPLRRRLVGLSWGFVPIVAGFVTVMASVYGQPWPNSISAKVGLSLEQLQRGLHYARVFAVHYPVVVLVLAASLWRWRDAGPDERLWLRAAAFFAAYPMAVGGDWMLGYRLFAPLIVVSATLVPFALAPLWVGRPSPPRRVVVAVGVLAACGLTAAMTVRDPHVAVATRPTLIPAAIRVGQWMRENLPRDGLLATNTAGTIPYYAELPVVDMMGINDRSIAARRDLPTGWLGIEKGDGEYVLARRPDYIQLGSYLGASVPLFLSDIELFASEDFHRWYALETIRVDDQTTLKLYRRLERPRGVAPGALARARSIAQRQLELSRFRY